MFFGKEKINEIKKKKCVDTQLNTSWPKEAIKKTKFK